MPNYTALVSLLAVLFVVFLGTRVSAARGKFGVKLPAIAGNPDFERVYRVHQNTLEWLPTFLVPLWLFAFYLSDVWAAALGLVWIAGRAWYYVGYAQATEKRIPGFFTQGMACIVLILGAAVGIVLRMTGH